MTATAPTDTTTPDSLESFVSLSDPPPGETTALAPVATVHTFQGKGLFPYDGAAAMLYEELSYGTADSGLYLIGLTFTLLDLQSSYSIYKARVVTDEDATEGAYAALLEIRASGPGAYLAQVIARAGKLKRAELREGVKLAETILRDFQAANPDEAETPPDAPEPASAVVTLGAKKTAPTGKRRGKAAAKPGEDA